MLVISIQSQVVHGHVGNSAAAYAMQAEGVNVAAVPTTLLSNHPRYPSLRGRVLETELVADLLKGVEERDLVDEAAVLVTGYLGSPGNAAVVADFVERALNRNSKLVYLCDPVIGDDGHVYVADGILDVVRHRLLPAANLTTPNQFELELLSGITIADAQDLRAACAALAGTGRIDVIATGCTLADTPDGQVETILCADGQLSRFATPRLPIRPYGTGDLLSGLIAAHLAKGKAMEAAVRLAVETIFAVLVRTQEAGSAEMRLVPLPTRTP
ncbi:pyridoxal kinase [Bradyrhizobium diazoefficiens]|uniref:pyridoxal kinase n=1 Tax=Bradyrhizobium diazoefficiens SEMIA 5080 TaxID=754504 RepID=A0A837CLC2_9BRAD|nr:MULTISPECIES: pyridoxal kinase [Bradyrhizobium]APO53700.1 pyridoxal kinase [Bradyrhizobium diazoefficiens]KGJ69785.1 putative pyridoxine kinase [Bradyrhizobium diazoefficiens SEMIA 5080]KOY10709.1 pyridoxal kinase [Bradyrhizobium diazoefficiens]MCD9296956.1 pyridoxal kinase [Bradyrhizobium diazoefficiens]MCD9809974.1 pyridoxal kinase [Bradyrhizobium diazoefficiens]